MSSPFSKNSKKAAFFPVIGNPDPLVYELGHRSRQFGNVCGNGESHNGIVAGQLVQLFQSTSQFLEVRTSDLQDTVYIDLLDEFQL